MTHMQPPPVPAAPPPVAAGRGDGMAVAALVLGLCSIILGTVPGLIAIILGIVALAQKTLRRGMAITGIVTGTVGLLLVPALLVSILLPSLGRARSLAKISICSANLNTIGKGYHIYLTEYDAPPADIDALIGVSLTPAVFKCPCAKSGRPADIFYLPAAMDADPLTIVACDFKGNHPDGSRNVLTNMGTVRALSEAAFQAELSQPYNTAFAAALRKVEGP